LAVRGSALRNPTLQRQLSQPGGPLGKRFFQTDSGFPFNDRQTGQTLSSLTVCHTLSIVMPAAAASRW
jgi:hypothetical protein